MAESLTDFLTGTILPLFLLIAGIFYGIRLHFFPFTYLPVILRVLGRKNPKSGVSPFRSLSLALAGTLGVGNIVGVASAVSMGGAGAVFWMWVSAILAMLLKYAEVFLSQRYRHRTGNAWHGGAPYYIKEGLSAHGFPRLGTILSIAFCVLCIADSFTTGCSIQSAAVARSLQGVIGFPPFLCGLLLAIACFLLLIRGTNAVLRVTDLLVPLMCGGFLFLSIICMAARPHEILPALGKIFREAFTPQSATGGVFGFFLSRAVRFGTMRGLLSNEAGCGTSPFAHAAADADSPVEQGFFGIFEVFVDTILLCTVTAVVIIMNPAGTSAFPDNPVMAAIRAYSSVFRGAASEAIEVFLAFSVLCFGFATLLCWAHYGLECVRWLFGNRKGVRLSYIFTFSAVIFLGAVAAPQFLWNFADLTIALMLFLHVPILCFFSDEVRRETLSYFPILTPNKKRIREFTKSP